MHLKGNLSELQAKLEKISLSKVGYSADISKSDVSPEGESLDSKSYSISSSPIRKTKFRFYKIFQQPKSESQPTITSDRSSLEAQRGSDTKTRNDSKTRCDASINTHSSNEYYNSQYNCTEKNSSNARFIIHPDGPHSHHLKPYKRQDKLKDMLRDILGGTGKAKKEEQNLNKNTSNGTSKYTKSQRYQAGETNEDTHKETVKKPHRLSLVQEFVDKVNKENMTNSLKDGTLNAPQTYTKLNTRVPSLTEKYGKCQEIVGRGAFGIVRISHKLDSKCKEKLFAVKAFKRRNEESLRQYTKRLTSEFCISSSLQHPNIIRTLDLIKDSKGEYCEVMEFCNGGDLYTLILTLGKLEQLEANCFFKQLMKGVNYMHDMGVAHRDLKPENLILTSNGTMKITDFGNGECFRMAWENEAHLTNGICGSAPYIAPEEFTDEEFDPRAVDVWACGVIYMAMITGRHLWYSAKKHDEYYRNYLIQRKNKTGYDPIESLSGNSRKSIIYSILDPAKSTRITSKQILNSEWVQNIELCSAAENDC